MKTYQLYVFTQPNCKPCQKLKTFVETLPANDQAELTFVPMRVKEDSNCMYCIPERTALATELDVEQTPTLVVVHEEQHCKFEPDDGYEFCDNKEIEVERFVGANNIIEHLDATIDAYTYAHPE